jgi:hypothetical protein
MLLSLALAVVSPCAQVPAVPVPAPAPLESRWIDGIGDVEIASAANGRLAIAIRDASGATRTREVELDLVAPDAALVEAHCAPFMKVGLVIGLAAQRGATTSYHALFIGRLSDQPGTARTNPPFSPEGRFAWRLTTPIFTSQGERYRMIDVSNSGGDTIEITYRRGFLNPRPRGNATLDEKIWVNVCPGSDPFVAGWLLDVPSALTPR